MSKRKSGTSLQESSTKRQCSNIHAISVTITKHLTKKENSSCGNDIIELFLKPVVERVSFSKQLQTVPSDTSPHLPIVTREYEETFMRSPMPDENACVAGESCECMMLDLERPFIGVQFQLPDMTANSNGFCVICLRKLTHILYHKTIQQGVHANIIIQKYGNICGEAGEYHPSAMLVCPQGGPVHVMPMPIVAHQRTRYIVSGDKRSGFKIRQRNVYMEDF